MNAAMFAIYGTSKRCVASIFGTDASRLTPRQVCIASWFAAPPYCLVVCPVDVVKNQLQFQGAAVERIYTGPIDCVRKLGLRGLYQGYLPTVGTRLVGSPFYFVTYEAVKSALLSYDPHTSSLTCGIVGGWLARARAWLACMSGEGENGASL